MRELRAGIDSGPKTSGFVLVEWEPERRVIYSNSEYDNDDLLRAFESRSLVIPDMLSGGTAPYDVFSEIRIVSIERIVPYGRSVGQETFDASWMGGEFALAARWRGKEVVSISRPQVKLALFGATTYSNKTGGRNAVDTKLLKECVKSNFDPYGGGKDPYKGLKGNKGPLFLVSGSHAWDALAVAVAGPIL